MMKIHDSLEFYKIVRIIALASHCNKQDLFANPKAGILIAESKSLGVLHYDNKYYFTDSHSCGPKGASTVNGKACIIDCDNVDEFHRVCK